MAQIMSDISLTNLYLLDNMAVVIEKALEIFST